MSTEKEENDIFKIMYDDHEKYIKEKQRKILLKNLLIIVNQLKKYIKEEMKQNETYK